MDNILKLPAQQALFDSKNRLVDLVIPANSGVYNLAECYVAVDIATTGLALDTTQAADGRLANTAGYVEAADAVADVRLSLKHNATVATIYDTCAMPVEALVRNASMFSATKGKLEDIRRSDVIRSTLKAYTDDIEDVEARSIGGLAPQAKTNPWASGRFAALVGVGSTASEYKSHELRIMLKDIFNIAATEEYDSAKMGATTIHLELNLDRVELKQALAATPDVWDRYYHNQQVGTISGPNDIKYKTALTVTRTNTSAAITSNVIEMAAPYQSLADSPFYNHQMVKVTTTITGGATSTPAAYPITGSVKWAVIKAITWDKDTQRVTLDFGAQILTVGAISVADFVLNRTVEGIPATSLVDKLSYQSVELTAVRRPDLQSGADQIQYTSLQAQSDQWANGTEHIRSYYLPPQTQTAFIVMPSRQTTGDFSDILGCARVGEYRFTINGESVTNRAVPYMQVPVLAATADAKTEKGSSLHYSLIAEAMMNSGVRYHSLREAVFSQDIPLSIDVPIDGNGIHGWPSLTAAPAKPCYLLALPIPISNEQTQLTIELTNSSFPASSGELHIFSEVRSVA